MVSCLPVGRQGISNIIIHGLHEHCSYVYFIISDFKRKTKDCHQILLYILTKIYYESMTIFAFHFFNRHFLFLGLFYSRIHTMSESETS